MDDLETYKAQLEQVQAALTTDPENEDLLKLQKDLEEVINLTLELATVRRNWRGRECRVMRRRVRILRGRNIDGLTNID